MKIIIEAGAEIEGYSIQSMTNEEAEPETFTAETPAEAGEMVASMLGGSSIESEAMEAETDEDMEASWNEEAEKGRAIVECQSLMGSFTLRLPNYFARSATGLGCLRWFVSRTIRQHNQKGVNDAKL